MGLCLWQVELGFFSIIVLFYDFSKSSTQKMLRWNFEKSSNMAKTEKMPYLTSCPQPIFQLKTGFRRWVSGLGYLMRSTTKRHREKILLFLFSDQKI